MSRLQLSITIVLLCSVTLLFPNVRCAPDTTYVTSWNTPEKYEEGSEYGDEIDVGLEELTNGVARDTNLQMVLTGRLAMGYAYCQPHLQDRRDDCTECLRAANEFLREDDGCAYAIAAYVVFADCGIRYDPKPQE